MIGTTVPWNAAWSGENSFEIRPCRFVGGRLALWQMHNPCQGKPMFAEPHVVRQRRSIAEMRCTVCGEKTPDGDRWWFEHGKNHEGWFMTTESPVHRACADHSVNVCPHLRKRSLDPQPFPFGARVLASEIKPESMMELYGISTEKRVIGHLKLAWPSSAIAYSSRKIATNLPVLKVQR